MSKIALYQRIKKILFWVVLSIASWAILLIIGYLTPRKWNYDSNKSDCRFEICVTNGGIHTDIIVPLNNTIFNWENYLSIEEISKNAQADYHYLSFGWGDRAFYMQTPTLADLKVSTTVQAIFFPTPSVLQVQGYASLPRHLEIKCVKVSPQNYLNLMKFIQTSFEFSGENLPIRLGDGYHARSGFYAAIDSYSILKTCNTWTTEGLRVADVNTPLWPWIPSAIMWHLKSGCE